MCICHPSRSFSLIFWKPVNVGYSYGKTKVKTSKESARDVYAFLQLFLGQFPEYAANPFHISGESYGAYNLYLVLTRMDG